MEEVFGSSLKYDEVVLCNNSCYSPLYDLNYVFAAMRERAEIDFWGITLFPYCEDGSYLDKKHIDEHIQSYFMVFNGNVAISKVFVDFWNEAGVPSTLTQTVSMYESELTPRLKNAGFKYDVLLRESKFMSEQLMNYAIPYQMPYLLLVLKSPFVKKKSMELASHKEKGKLLCFLQQFKLKSLTANPR